VTDGLRKEARLTSGPVASATHSEGNARAAKLGLRQLLGSAHGSHGGKAGLARGKEGGAPGGLCWAGPNPKR
jgi:hypothetical protein